MMSFKPVILWTDALLYLLLAVVVLFVLYARRKEHLRAPWRRVLQRRSSMATVVILSVYIGVGLSDSIHFRLALPDQVSQQNSQQDSKKKVHYSVEVLSLLDVLAGPIRKRVEKTFSAPFAAHLYAKESVEQPEGGQIRTYPRLLYGGSHLQDPSRERALDILSISLIGLLQGLAAWGALSILLVAWLARRNRVSTGRMLGTILRRETEMPWHVFFFTTGVILLLALMAAKLGVKYHILGTDKVGQDVFFQSVKSIRTGLLIGTLTTLIMLPFAVALGIMAGYFRGWVDDVIQYLYTTLSSIPGVLLIAAAILSLQIFMANNPEWFETMAARADIRLLFLCVILGITSWTGLCRLLRGETLKLREMDYIQAAAAFGVNHLRIISRHILPNVMHIVMIAVVLDFSGLVLAEAVLSYVGVGVDPTMISWGNMINSARLDMAREPMVWWSLLAAFVFMFGLVLSANLFSDSVRDAFDPRLTQR